MKRERLVLKIGTATLTRGTPQISRGKIEDLARQFVELRRHYEVLLVSSGAIATARQFVELTGGSPIGVKQALAAIGQPQLMRIYQEVFADFGLKTAQCLLTYRDFDNARSRENTRTTLEVLLANGYIPVINENDTVATEEIQFGDNDQLAARTAILAGARLLLLASDIPGLYDKDPARHPDARIIPRASDPDALQHLVFPSANGQGSGGMQSKLEAAARCLRHGIETYLVDGRQDNFALRALNGELPCTRFAPD